MKLDLASAFVSSPRGMRRASRKAIQMYELKKLERDEFARLARMVSETK